MKKDKIIVLCTLCIGLLIGSANLNVTHANADQEATNEGNHEQFLIKDDKEVKSVEEVSYEEIEVMSENNSSAQSIVDNYGDNGEQWYIVTSIKGNGEERITFQRWGEEKTINTLAWNYDGGEGTTKHSDYRPLLDENPKFGNEWRYVSSTNRTANLNDKSPNAIVQEIGSLIFPPIGVAQSIYDYFVNALPENNMYLTEIRYMASGAAGFTDAFVIEMYEESTRTASDFIGYKITYREVVE
ncbi:hypothetical protein [Oceanobacillus jeddahense]|uniref:hypothetical protein n=1 Tax=Oceanobacillus jeddahense TaxID=1462527 RepID=UPI00362E2A2D